MNKNLSAEEKIFIDEMLRLGIKDVKIDALIKLYNNKNFFNVHSKITTALEKMRGELAKAAEELESLQKRSAYTHGVIEHFMKKWPGEPHVAATMEECMAAESGLSDMQKEVDKHSAKLRELDQKHKKLTHDIAKSVQEAMQQSSEGISTQEAKQIYVEKMMKLSEMPLECKKAGREVTDTVGNFRLILSEVRETLDDIEKTITSGLWGDEGKEFYNKLSTGIPKQKANRIVEKIKAKKLIKAAKRENERA